MTDETAGSEPRDGALPEWASSLPAFDDAETVNDDVLGGWDGGSDSLTSTSWCEAQVKTLVKRGPDHEYVERFEAVPNLNRFRGAWRKLNLLEHPGWDSCIGPGISLGQRWGAVYGMVLCPLLLPVTGLVGSALGSVGGLIAGMIAVRATRQREWIIAGAAGGAAPGSLLLLVLLLALRLIGVADLVDCIVILGVIALPVVVVLAIVGTIAATLHFRSLSKPAALGSPTHVISEVAV